MVGGPHETRNVAFKLRNRRVLPQRITFPGTWFRKGEVTVEACTGSEPLLQTGSFFNASDVLYCAEYPVLRRGCGTEEPGPLPLTMDLELEMHHQG